MASQQQLRISRDEISQAFLSGDWSSRYPPLLTVDQAAALLAVPKATIYAWRSQGKLTGCSQRLGKHLRFFRDRLIQKVMNDGV